MGYKSYVPCANQKCDAECGTDHAATFTDSGYVDLYDGALVDDQGDVFCSQECFQVCHPVYCDDCGDEVVENVGDRCPYCKIQAEQGDDAADAWFVSQHPELLRKPVASVPATAVYRTGSQKAG